MSDAWPYDLDEELPGTYYQLAVAVLALACGAVAAIIWRTLRGPA